MVFINKSGYVRVPALAYQWIPPRNDIFNFWLFSSLFLTCMGWSCRWDLHISPLSLSLLHCSSVCVRCWPRVWHLFAFGLGEEEVREGIQGGVQQRGYGGAARHPGCLLRPYGQIYKMNTTKKWYFPFLTCMDIIYIIWVGSCRWDLHISPLSQSSWLKYSFQKRKRESGEI